MANKLQGKRVAFLATDMVEQVELTEPWNAVKADGAEPELVSLEEGEIQGFNHYDKADKFKVDRIVEEARADDYDALVIPGGVGNPDTLRTDEDAVEFTAQVRIAPKVIRIRLMMTPIARSLSPRTEFEPCAWEDSNLRPTA